MGAKVRLKRIMKAKKIKAEDIAAHNGTSLQNIYNVFHRDNMKYDYVEQIADFLGCDIVFRDRETGEEY